MRDGDVDGWESSSKTMTNGKVSVVGLGHVGLVTALGLAEIGWTVVGTDSDPKKLAAIRDGKCPFYEPGLQQLLVKHLDSRRFVPNGNLADSVSATSVVFICVGTPQKESGEADLSQLDHVARAIAEHSDGNLLLVEKSTAPVTSARWIARTVQQYGRDGVKVNVACNPEFLREGTAVNDFLHPDRIVLGVDCDETRDTLLKIYEPIDCPKLVTDLNTAELIKHSANAFLSTKISFINMVADLCEATGADVTKVAEGMGLDPRIGPAYLGAGIGFGGYCFPKDIRAFVHIGESHRVDMSLLKAAEQINLKRVDRFLEKLRARVWVLRGKTIGILGLAFKAGTDDVRESPALAVVRQLHSQGAILRLYDPQAMDAVRQALPEEPGRLEYVKSPYEVAKQADAVLLLTEWPEFANLDLAKLRDSMRLPVIGDGRNLLDPAAVRVAGIDYFSLGRP